MPKNASRFKWRTACLLTCCLSVPAAAADTRRVPPASEIAAVKARFAPLQHLSFAVGYEYCGYLGRTVQGSMVFTEMVRGDWDGCTPPAPPSNFVPIASMHTHGAYDPFVPAEFPTVLDLEADHIEGVDGYVATPGGRLWYIDGRAMEAIQICGEGCLPQDPDFRSGDDGAIAKRYTLKDLQALEYTH
ncbi:DUF4329 domain-containing protein [Ruegeria sediminis]|uniref:DUF4329 domain-containing protein n=1 Tax=Ruegeria sediminis TaxID=2583820 RepID=A0ABY2X5P0_9RHOB|nr:DUF4329 domain-containing protein [Ruegeria sediminis]TMV10137.1 DUF4329 domain-containing protein [Ruegeria sediminis]